MGQVIVAHLAWVQGLGFRVQGSGFRVQGRPADGAGHRRPLGLGSGIKVQKSKFRFNLGFRVQGCYRRKVNRLWVRLNLEWFLAEGSVINVGSGIMWGWYLPKEEVVSNI